MYQKLKNLRLDTEVHVPESVKLALPARLDVVPLDVEVLVTVRPETCSFSNCQFPAHFLRSEKFFILFIFRFSLFSVSVA